jgi:hypothetical protein
MAEARFYGVQDEYISSNLVWDNPCCSYDRTNKYIVTGKELCFSTPQDAEGGYAYGNLRLEGDPKTIQSVELLIGGQRVDKIWPVITGQMSFSILDTHNLQALKVHAYKLYIEHTGDVEVHVDKSKLFTPFKQSKQGEILYTSTQYNGKEKVTAGRNEVRLYFNHPIEKISVFGDARCIELNLDGYIIPASEFVFKKTINFSRVEKAILVVEAPTDGEIHVFADSKNVARMTDEMFGVRFSK